MVQELDSKEVAARLIMGKVCSTSEKLNSRKLQAGKLQRG